MILRGKQWLLAILVGLPIAVWAVVVVFCSDSYHAAINLMESDAQLKGALGKVEYRFLTGFRGSDSVDANSILRFFVVSDRGRFFVEFRFRRTTEGLIEEGVWVDGELIPE